MANLSESETYEAGIYQLERSDAVDAGTSGNGVSNLQPKQLANRTNWLRARLLELLVGGVAGNPVAVNKGGFGLDNSAVAAGNIPFLSALGAFGFTPSTAYGRSLLNQATAFAAAQTLNVGLGRFASGQTNTEFITTSGSYQDTGLSVTITPQSTSSKILVLSCPNLIVKRDNENSAGGYTGIYRGTIASGTLVAANKLNILVTGIAPTSIRSNQAAAAAAVDTPNTTSPVTYRLAVRGNSAGHEITLNFGADTTSFLFAMEILV